ncbi:hypothetical protein M9458_022669, partial [Cirrhinus mrigala]
RWRTASVSCVICRITCTRKFLELRNFTSKRPITARNQEDTIRRRTSRTVLEDERPK